MTRQPRPSASPLPRPALTGAGFFLRTLAGELRAAPASPPAASPRTANDNGHRPAFA